MISALIMILAFYGVVCMVGMLLLVLWELLVDRRSAPRDPLERLWRLPSGDVHDEIRGRRP